jgi:hypothetical protein
MAEKPAQQGATVTINGKFVREQAKEAVHQFFRPITAPFEHTKPSNNAKPNRPRAS